MVPQAFVPHLQVNSEKWFSQLGFFNKSNQVRSKCFTYVTLLTAFPLVWRYAVSSLAASVRLSSSSESSTLSNALALATGDFGEVGRIT